jgi:squalene synthase HpnC
VGRLTELEEARGICRGLAARHYENFPVGRMVPRDVRPDIHAIYAFARVADDFADEPAYEGRRTELLDSWGAKLEACAAGAGPDEPVFVALADTIRRREVPVGLLWDLLGAFRQDAVKSRYENWDEVLDYCTRSANPVGRLVLWVTNHREEKLLPFSDALCTALQLANFWQDLSVDHARGRSYVPRADAAAEGVDLEALVRGEPQEGFAALLDALVGRTRELFEASSPLPRRLRGLLRWEIAATWHGGRLILERTAALGERALHVRPSITAVDKAVILARSLRYP